MDAQEHKTSHEHQGHHEHDLELGHEVAPMTFLTSFFISPAYRFTAPGITSFILWTITSCSARNR